MSSFTGFSEEDLKRIKSVETQETDINTKGKPEVTTNIKQSKIGLKQKRVPSKVPLDKHNSDEAINVMFDKCRLSIKKKVSMDNINNNELSDLDNSSTSSVELNNDDDLFTKSTDEIYDTEEKIDRDNNTDVTPDLVRSVDYSEDDIAAHSIKLGELQMKQKIMEEQNKKRKEMLAKALADRTKQTEEEVMRLEKIKKELQVIDGQFSQDVSVLRKKIDQACLSYADAEKHYLKIEKEFLQAKINLQKEREKKELLTEHLCALITHNETRKAQKLETLMLELANDRKSSIAEVKTPSPVGDDDSQVVVDGVCEKTGKMVEL